MAARIGLRRRLQLSVICAVGLVLVALIGAFNLVLRDRLSHEANNVLFTRASAELASLRVTGSTLRAPELPDAGALDAQAWVFAGNRVLEQPPSDPATQRAAELISRGPRRTKDVAATIRLYTVPVVSAAGQRLGAVVAEVSLKPYESTAQTALFASAVLGAVVLLIVGIGSRALISGALRPVARMTAQAAAWSEADTGRRFDLGPPRDELTQLAATLDGLLDRVATSLRHEQRFSAELSHELRTPLASVIAEAQLALRRPRSPEAYRAGYERVLASAQEMARTLETLMTAARVEFGVPHRAGDAVEAAHAAARGCAAAAERRGIEITVIDPDVPIRVGVETEVAERVLAPLIQNGCRYGRGAVQIGIDRRDGAVLFSVLDDGPGVAEPDRDRIFEPGWRGSHSTEGGAGLGLPLARRLARAAGGDVEAQPSADGGRFTVRLPAG